MIQPSVATAGLDASASVRERARLAADGAPQALGGPSWLYLAVFIGLGLPAYFVIGSVGAALWRWFVLPIWPLAPHLTPAQFAGLWIVLRYVRGFAIPTGESSTEPVSVRVFTRRLVTTSFYLPLVGLALGWLVKAVWL